MANRIPAELPGGVKIGTILAFARPAAVAVGAVAADLNGVHVGLRWRYADIAAVIFKDWASAELWPGFEAHQ